MAFTYDLSTDIGKVRLLLSDVELSKYIFEDEEVQVFLDMEGGTLLLAGARALEVIAANEVLVQKRIKNLDLSTDGPSEAKALRELSKAWREQFAESGDVGVEDSGLGFDIAEQVYDEFTMRERLRNEVLGGLY